MPTDTPYRYDAAVLKVSDGDTVRMDFVRRVTLGLGILFRVQDAELSVGADDTALSTSLPPVKQWEYDLGFSVRMGIALCTHPWRIEITVRMKQIVRLHGINAPELHGAADPDPGQKAKAYLMSLLPEGASVQAATFKDAKEKYGRLLARIEVPGAEKSVNDAMVVAGHAKPYFGVGPRAIKGFVEF